MVGSYNIHKIQEVLEVLALLLLQEYLHNKMLAIELNKPTHNPSKY